MGEAGSVSQNSKVWLGGKTMEKRPWRKEHGGKAITGRSSLASCAVSDAKQVLGMKSP